jgi:hypothetical protein
LGSWLNHQRMQYRRGRLKSHHYQKLADLGFILEPKKSGNDDPSFEDRIMELREYYDEYNDLRVPQHCTAGRSKDLGKWVEYIRDGYQWCLQNPTCLDKEDTSRLVLGPYQLSKLRIERLETMGFEWSIHVP